MATNLELAGHRAFCPKGQHRTHKPPVVCRPNERAEEKTAAPLPEFPLDVPNFGASIFVFAVLIFLVGKLAGRFTNRRAEETIIVRSSLDTLALGGLVKSPNVGLGDLGWGSWKQGALLPRERLNLHVLVAGATGSGKSTTVDRIELEAARSYRPQVIHFDCKGRRDGAERFLSIMIGAGYEDHEVRVAPVEPYDGWRGDDRAHLNRLLAIQDFSDSQPYYTAATKDLLQQTFRTGSVLPRFSDEFLERLVREHPRIDPKVASGTIARYRGFFHSLAGMLDGSWAFEDVGACYIELPGMARREDAVAFGRYLLEDFMHYIAERKPPERKVLLVLDDFSAISSGQEAVNLVERAREFGVGVVLTTQSYAGLGPGADRIVDACNGALFVHRMSNPEPFISRAGTVWRQTTSVTQPARQPGLISGVLLGKEPEMPKHTTRDQEFPRIDANEARSLPPGEAFVIADGKTQRITVSPVSDLDVEVKMPYVGTVTLVSIARGNLKMRKETNADLHAHQTVKGPSTTPDDADLDF